MKKLLFLVFFILCFPALLSATPAHVATTDPTACATCGASGNTYSRSVTVSSGTNLVLVANIRLGHHCSFSGVATPTISSVTYAGSALTPQNDVTNADAGCDGYGRVAQYTLVNPPVGTANFVVTTSANAVSLHAFVSVYSGVNQSTPVRSVGSQFQRSTATTISASLSGAFTSDLLVDVVCDGTGITSVDGGQTQRGLRNIDANDTCNNSATSTQPASTDPTLGWTVSRSGGTDNALMSVLALEDATLDSTPPSNASGLSVNIISSTELLGSFTAGTDDQQITYHSVERCSGVGCSSFSEVRQLGVVGGVPNTTFTDTELAANTVYCYRVRPFDGTNYSTGYTSTVCKTTLITQTVILLWSDDSSDETNFIVERRVESSGYADLATKSADVETHTDTTSPQAYSGTAACYRVRATKTSNPDSAPSNEVCTSLATAVGSGSRAIGLRISGGVTLR